MRSKLFVWFASFSLLILLTFSAAAQKQPNETRSITGCLHQGVEPGGYYLDSHDGKMWELRGSVSKSDVGREVTLQGREREPSISHQTSLITDEKQESDGRPFQGFEVSKTTALSNSCRSRQPPPQ